MKLPKLTTVFVMLPLTIMFALPSTVQVSHEQTTTQTGTVCIAPGSSSYGCPNSPSFIGFQPIVAVNIVNTTGYNSFDIMVKADPNVLNATGFDFETSSTLPNPVVTLACLNGQSIGGIRGCSKQDGPGVAHLSAAAGCAGVTLACGFGDGNLFRVHYDALQTGPVTTVGFQTGCTNTSNSNSCVTIQFLPADIACCPPPDPEYLQPGIFTTSSSTTIAPFSQAVTFDGVTAIASGNLFVDKTARTLAGSVSVTATNVTTGSNVYSTSFNISLAFSGNSRRFVIVIPTASTRLGITCAVSLQNGSTSCFMSLDPDLGNFGSVDLIDVSMVFFAYGSTPGSSRWNPASDLDSNGVVDLIDAGISAADFGAPALG